jgi:hypothetical protein
LGLKCKQLIDAGRCAWLQTQLAPLMQQQQHEQGAEMRSVHVQRVSYIDESLSGENTLLVLGQC